MKYDYKTAGRAIKKLLKDNGINVTYKSDFSISFDYVIRLHGDDADYEKARKLIRDNGFIYSDPENDMMTDYFGCNNSLVTFNGYVC